MSVIPGESSLPAEMADSGMPAFAGRAVQILNEAFTALMISIGHQTKLFDVMATLPPATSVEIAAASGLNERYVREWLSCMATAAIVRYDSSGSTFFLPPEHAPFLTRAAGPDNFAMFMQFVGLLGEVEQQVVAAFRTGGGVPYSAYERFQELQGEESRQMYDANLIQNIVPLDAQLLQRLTAGVVVGDVGTGSGHATNLLARAFPASNFRGFDMSSEGIERASAEAGGWGLGNVKFEVRDVATMREENAFDVLTAFDVIHDLAKPRQVLAAIHRALRADGIFMMVDIAASSSVEGNCSHPFGPMLYAVSTMHCMTVSLEQGGEGLGTAWGKEKAIELLNEAGFSRVTVHQLEGDPIHAFYFARK